MEIQKFVLIKLRFHLPYNEIKDGTLLNSNLTAKKWRTNIRSRNDLDQPIGNLEQMLTVLILGALLWISRPLDV